MKKIGIRKIIREEIKKINKFSDKKITIDENIIIESLKDYLKWINPFKVLDNLRNVRDFLSSTADNLLGASNEKYSYRNDYDGEKTNDFDTIYEDLEKNSGFVKARQEYLDFVKGLSEYKTLDKNKRVEMSQYLYDTSIEFKPPKSDMEKKYTKFKGIKDKMIKLKVAVDTFSSKRFNFDETKKKQFLHDVMVKLWQ